MENLEELKKLEYKGVKLFPIIEYPFTIEDEDGNVVYWERKDGYWTKHQYGNNGNETYYEDSTGYWIKREYDDNNRIVYSEDSKGISEDNRPKPDNPSTDPYIKWLEQQIEICLNDKDLQREHWAFCRAYQKLVDIKNNK